MLALVNTILANTPASATDCFINGNGTTTGSINNLIESNGAAANACAGVLVTADPNLGALTLNTPGKTATHALPNGSPAIDQGAATAPATTTDQRGLMRPTDFPAVANAAGGNGADIGAYETGCPTITVTSGSVPSGTAGTAYGPVNFMQSGGNGTITWSVSSNNLPAGLTLNATTGVLSGMPSVAAGVNIIVRATDANGCFGETTVTLQINCPTIGITPSTGATTTLTAGTAGQAYSQTFTAAPAGGAYSYSIPMAAIPPGLNFNTATGVLSGTPTTTGTFGFTVTATGFGVCTGQQSYSLTIGCPTINVTAPAVNTATVGVAFSQSFTQTGGVGTTNFQALTTPPTGLTLSTAGVLSGTPAVSGAFTFTVRATDSNNCTGMVSYTLTIGCPTVTLAPATLPGGTYNVAYGQTLTAAGLTGAFTFALQAGSSMPPGLTLSAAGLISGTPTQPSAFTFTVIATHTASGCTGNRTYSIGIQCPAINIAPATLPQPIFGVAYNQPLTGSGGVGPYTFALANGLALPAGLTLSSAGVISGTPTLTGAATFTVNITDTALAAGQTNCAGNRTYTVTVVCPAIVLSPATLPSGTAGMAYNQTVSATPSGTTYSFAVTAGTLPAGLSLNGATGAITGTPTMPGNSTFTITATGFGTCTGTQQYTVTIACPTITLAPATLPAGTAGAAYSQTLTATPAGGNYSFTVTSGALPAGLALNANGMLSGTPTVTGAFTFTVTATGFGTCTGAQTYTLTINCQTITVTAPATNTGTAGTAFSATFTQTGGIGATTFSTVSTLPSGFTLSSAGVLSGTTTQTGAFPISVKATDSNGCMGTASYTLTINPPPCAGLVLNPASLPVGMKGNPYSVSFTAANANGAVSFARTAGALPPGLTLASNGLLSGTPTQLGSFDFTITVTDAINCTASRSYTLVIDAQTASIGDPLICLGPGGVVNVEATVTNGGAAPQTVTFTATPDPGLRVLANTCVVNTGTCTIDTQNNRVNWNGTLTANQTVTIRYQSQVADDAAPGTQLCVNSTAFVNGAGPFTVQACTRVTCPPVGPGQRYSSVSPISDQKAGSVLIFNLYTSSASGATIQNTRLSLTNIDAVRTAYVHLFFVDGATCSIADSIVCLTPNQTSTFFASDVDPGTTGYLIAVATDRNGCPINFNHLIGDEFVKLNSGHAANLGAEAIAALPGGFAPYDPLASAVELRFDNVMYNALPRVLALSNIASRADGNDTLLVVNRLGGSLATGAATLTGVFGILYDDTETPFSFSFSPGTCQFRSLISSSFPRTTPRFEQVVPAGRSGWLKLGMQTEGAVSGAALNFNANAATAGNAFNQGHNLHKLTLTTAATVTVPVFPPSC